MKKISKKSYKHSSVFYQDKYDKYNILYNKLVRKNKGEPMGGRLSLRQFIMAYENEAANLAEQGKYSRDIVKSISEQQFYHLTYSQARAYKQQFEITTNSKITIEDVRKMTWKERRDLAETQLKQMNDSLKLDGYNGKERAKMISQVWFGSD